MQYAEMLTLYPENIMNKFTRLRSTPQQFHIVLSALSLVGFLDMLNNPIFPGIFVITISTLEWLDI